MGSIPKAGEPTTDAPRVTLQVRSLERFVAPPEPLDLSVRPDGTPLRGRVVAGAGSGFDVSAPPRGPALLEIEEGDRLLLRYAPLGDPRQPPLTVGARVMVRGVVQDDQGQPLPGASVWFGERLASGAPRSFGVDEQGAFEADVPAGRGVPFVVRAAGYATKWRVISAPVAAIGGGASSGPDELREMLEPAATLHLQVAGRAFEIERARAYVLPPTGQVSSGLSQWPFFAQIFGPGYAVDATGKAVIPDLPQRGSVRVVVRHPAVGLASPTAVTLSSALTRATVPLRFDARVQQGAVVDEDGQGVASAWLFGRVPGQRLEVPGSSRLLPPYADLRRVWVARADADGHFSMGTPAAEGAHFAVRAHGHAGRDVPLDAAMNAEIVLPRWRGGDASLTVAPPVAGAAWWLVSDLGGGVMLACDADAAGTLALPHCGRFAVEARVEHRGAEPVVRSWPSLTATGPVELATAR